MALVSYHAPWLQTGRLLHKRDAQERGDMERERGRGLLAAIVVVVEREREMRAGPDVPVA
jgi:hypothetical protein